MKPRCLLLLTIFLLVADLATSEETSLLKPEPTKSEAIVPSEPSLLTNSDSLTKTKSQIIKDQDTAVKTEDGQMKNSLTTKSSTNHDLTKQETRKLNDSEISENCNHRVLQYYGMAGWTFSLKTGAPETDGFERYCPHLTESCCSHSDFVHADKMWTESLPRIKGYLTKTFRVIQKIVMMQTSFISFVQNMSVEGHPSCRQIDTTFFNPPVAFDEIHSYLNAALLSMAYIQKGFYCTICDAKQQKFFFQRQDFGQLGLTISNKSCSDIVHRFKEFIMYKVYYLDPFVENAKHMLTCAGQEAPEYTSSYQASYQEIRDCLETNTGCENLCAEFKYGGVSDLFMGDLGQLENILKALELLGNETKIIALAEKEDVYIPEYEILSRDFFQPEHQLTLLEQENIAVGCVSKMNVRVEAAGIDLFDTATQSNFHLENQHTNREKERIYNVNALRDEPVSLMGEGVIHSTTKDNNLVKKPLSVTQKIKNFFVARKKSDQNQEKLKGIFDDDERIDELSHAHVENLPQVTKNETEDQAIVNKEADAIGHLKSDNEQEELVNQANHEVEPIVVQLTPEQTNIVNQSPDLVETSQNNATQNEQSILTPDTGTPQDLEIAKFNAELNHGQSIDIDRQVEFDPSNINPDDIEVNQRQRPINTQLETDNLAQHDAQLSQNTLQNDLQPNSTDNVAVISQIDRDEGVEDEMQIKQVPNSLEETHKIEELPPNHKPTTEELDQLKNEIQRKEDERDEFTQKNGSLEDFREQDAEDQFNDFKGVRDIQDLGDDLKIGVMVNQIAGRLFGLWVTLVVLK